MKPDPNAAVHLLHCAAFGVLATQAARMPGYPFATALPFVPDEEHCPVFLLSSLAEHTKNLLADPRASLLVAEAETDRILEAPRMTLVGDVVRCEVTDAMRARYVRYLPEAADYLELGDFAFFRLSPLRLRYIGGFAQMGWLESDAWAQLTPLAPQDEAALLQELEAAVPPTASLLGIDCYGIDLRREGRRARLPFSAPLPADRIAAEAATLLSER